jgi:transposase
MNSRFEDEEGSTKMTKDTTIFAGIDTGKQFLDIALHPNGERLQVPNEAAGWDKLLAWLKSHAVAWVGIEASGGYERGVVERLREAGCKVRLLQPSQVRAFAAYHLKRAKNDRLDARLIAACMAGLGDPDRAPPDSRLQRLAEWLRLIEQIETDIVRAKTRRESFREPRHQVFLTQEIARLKKTLKAEMADLIKELVAHDDLARRFDLIKSIDGIGERTALAILLLMPELGSVSREEAAALAGLAPFDHESGAYKGQRRIAGGRDRVRRALYAAALPASYRWNKALCAFYKRLIAAGKPHKKALIACARKLLIFANTVLKRGEEWSTVQPNKSALLKADS